MRIHQLAAASLALAFTACASAPPGAESIVSQAPLCAPGVSLGKVVIAPLTRWRVDQKEPEVREAIAAKAIEAVAPSISCAASARVLPIAADANALAKLAEAKAGGATTVVFIRIDELGPIAILSFPALWSTWSDVKFTLDAVDVGTGQVIRSIPHRRQKGGAFEVRGLDPLRAEMELALRDVILGAR
ncbi:MAG: hypothetical protein ABMA14_06010 [Hyphomonadaceae bacterium]